MKNIALIAFLFLSLSSFSKELRANYEIISDTKDVNIPKGKYIIQGTVYDYYTKEILNDVTIISGSKSMKNQLDGSFKIKNSIKITYLNFGKTFFRDTYLEDYKFLSQHRIKIKIFLIQEQEEQHFEVKKPVIYCYSDKDLSFYLYLKPRGELVFSYPKLIEHVSFPENKMGDKFHSWNMTLKNNVMSEVYSGNTYPYLFWESVQNDIKFFFYRYGTDGAASVKNLPIPKAFPGEIVAKNDLLNFFDTTLTNLGLNSTEKTDFITFWLPQMQKKDLYLIQFLQDEECEQFATYQIEPKPTKVNRIYMLFSGLENNSNLQTRSQNLKKMERNGFYIVDWGGVEVPIKEDLKPKMEHNE
ncbi:MAG: hypothetical protein V4622_00980 [Bacteroidota bacterium]